MLREKGPAKLSPAANPDPYTITESTKSKMALVLTGRSQFLVVSGHFSRWKTLVFERHSRPDCWVMRREIEGEMLPERAVIGHLMKTGVDLDPMTAVKQRLENFEKAYFKTLNENHDLKEKLRVLQIKSRK
jgi:hypothetical protein